MGNNKIAHRINNDYSDHANKTLMLLSCLLTAFYFLSPSPASTRVLTFPSEYSSLNEAYNAANEYDTIFIEAGTHSNDFGVTISKQGLTILGQDVNNTVIYHRQWRINCSGDKILIKNLSFDVRSSFGICIDNGCILDSCWLFGDESGGYTAIFAGNGYYIRNCKIHDNHSASYGGGIYAAGGGEESIIEYNEIYENTADWGGGGLFVGYPGPTIRYNIIYNNVAVQKGGGIMFSERTSPILNNTIAGNSAPLGSAVWFYWNNPAGLSPFNNNIIADNVNGAAIYNGSNICYFGNCNCYWNNSMGNVSNWYQDCGNPPLENNCILANPSFCNAPADTFTIDFNSPCANDSICGQIGALGIGCDSVEYITTPYITGQSYGQKWQVLWFMANGAVSSEGHPLEYQWDWGFYEGPNDPSDWSPDNPKDNQYPLAETYYIRVHARCALHPERISYWSEPFTVCIECNSGSISGTVTDASTGFGIENAHLRILQGGSEVDDAYSYETGEYIVSGLSPASYDVEASADGYYTQTQYNISVEAMEEMVVDFALTAIENMPPVAFIDEINPNPANEGASVLFSGHGEDGDGYITNYVWYSNIDDIISTNMAFDKFNLSPGVHTISLIVQDNDGVWSDESQSTLEIFCCGDLGFRPSINGWQFSNSEKNMWPESWWQQFNYQMPPYPQYYFENCKSCYFPDWPLFVEAYGEENCYYSRTLGSFKPEAIAKWKTIIYSGQRNGKYGGSCLGFSLSAFLFFDDCDGCLGLWDTFGYPELIYVPLSDSSRKFINKYQVYMWSKLCQENIREHKNDDPMSTFGECKSMFNDPIRNDKFLAIPGHAVNPYKCEIDDENQYLWKVSVYDNRYPGVDTFLTIHSQSNMWTYGEMYGDNNVFLGDQIGEYTIQQEFKQKDKLNGSFFLDFISPDSNMINVYFSSYMDSVRFISECCNIGHIYDSIYGESTCGWPIWPFLDSDSFPIGYNLVNSNWQCSLSSVSDSIFRIFIYSDSMTISHVCYSNERSPIMGMSYSLSNNSISVCNRSAFEYSNNVELISTFIDSSIVYTISDIVTNLIDTINIINNLESGMIIENLGEGKNFDLRVEIVNEYFDTVFYAGGIFIPDNSGYLVIPDWRINADSLMVLADIGLTGIYEDTILFKNEGLNPFICGDANGSKTINILDVTYIINYLYKDGDAPNPIESADCDGNGGVNLLDVTYLINYLYKGGPEPVCQ